MHNWQSLSHVRWECKYRIVWGAKKRRKIMYGKLRQELRTILKRLCQYKGVEVVEGTMCGPHPHVFSHSPKIFNINHRGVPQGQERDDCFREIQPVEKEF